MSFGNEGGRFSGFDEAQVLQAVKRQMREGVVDHQVINVTVLDPSLGKRIGTRDSKGS